MATAATVSVPLKQLGITAKSCSVRDLWEHKDMGSSGDALGVPVPGGMTHYYGALFSLSGCK